MSVCPSFRMENPFRSSWKDFHEFRYLKYFSKIYRENFKFHFKTSKDEAQTALFKNPVRTAL